MATQELTVGGWTAYHPLTPADQKVFDEAMKGIIGVIYTPKEVSTQVVAGVNYRYRCNASVPPSEVVWEAIVEIFAPLEGAPYVVSIHRI